MSINIGWRCESRCERRFEIFWKEVNNYIFKTLLLCGGVKEGVKKVRKKILQNLKRCKQLLVKIGSNVVPIRSKNNNIKTIQAVDITFLVP